MLPLHSLSGVDDILTSSKTIALVGFSPKANRPSHMVGRYLMEAGFTVYPVNPGISEVLGLKVYPDLQSIPAVIDIVDIFRRSDDVYPIVESAIAVGAKVIWMQQGIINSAAADLAEKAGLHVVMDRCLKVDHAASLQKYSS